MKRNTNSGDQQNDNFSDLLNKFDDAATEKEWRDLIDEAKIRDLTFRQKEAIIARCENCIKGTFGNTKSELQMNAGKYK